jgi:putative redox protein
MTGRASVGVPTREVSVEWLREGLLFEGRAGDRPPVQVDGETRRAMSPMEMLLLCAAGCTGTDVVIILRKQRVGLRRLHIAITGLRRDTEPRRYTSVHFRFTVDGEGADEARVRRAIDLSLSKYCSVVASLAPDTQVTYDVVTA